MEAAKGFRRLKAYKHLPVLKAALAAHQSKYVTHELNKTLMPHSIHPRRCLLRLLQQNLGHPQSLAANNNTKWALLVGNGGCWLV
jgi:hypothetical protein